MNRKIILALCLLFLAVTPFKTDASAVEPSDLLIQVIVPEGAEYAVIDVLDGVEARYRLTNFSDIYGVFSCAGYVKTYYEIAHGVNVQNLTDLGPPHPQGLFVRADAPRKGDIIFYPSPPSRNNHSAIVKAFDGQRITLIEQNYKWAQADGTYTYLNRTIPYPPDSANPYEIWRLDSAPVFLTGPEEEFTVSPADDSPADTLPVDDTAADDIPVSDDSLVLDEIPVYEEPSPSEDTEGIESFDAELPSGEHAPSYTAVVTIKRMAINVNGLDMPVDACALIENERTVMPVRWVSYALGLRPDDIFWEPDSATVMVINNDDTIIFTAGSDVLFINNHPVIMDCPAFLRSGRSYLPVKYLADALGVEYVWDNLTASVTFIKR